jgi:hypothetical protein
VLFFSFNNHFPIDGSFSTASLRLRSPLPIADIVESPSVESQKSDNKAPKKRRKLLRKTKGGKGSADGRRFEPRIWHLKSDFRFTRIFLKGQKGDAINMLLATITSNLSL